MRQVEPSVVTVVLPHALGSGVIWSSDGTIVTDAHVACGTDSPTPSCKGSKVQVQFADGKVTGGTVSALDTVTDLALVKTGRSGVPAAKFASTLPPVGSLDVVIGSPLGLEQTVTAGIISATHRDLPPGRGHLPLVNLVQTDAPISPGNSGGAVVAADNTVIGLAEAYLSPQSGAVSIGFFTPATTVVKVVDELQSHGHAAHAYLGIADQDLTPQISQQFGLQQDSGVLVLQVAGGSPAQRAGLQPGDVITKIGSQRVQDQTSLFAALLDHRPGDKVTITFVRHGRQSTTTVTLGHRP